MGKKILIIDDEPDILQLAMIRLTKAGYEVRIASNTEDAFNMIGEEVPDLILLDVVMPDRDGYEVCNELKSREKTRNVPVILFTANPEQKERVKKNYEFIAADGYILKPFEPADLLKKVKKFTG